MNKIKILILLFLVNVGCGYALNDAETNFKNSTIEYLKTFYDNPKVKSSYLSLVEDLFKYSIDDEIVPAQQRPICHRFNPALNRFVCHWHIVNGCSLPKLNQFKDLTDGLTEREKYLLQVAALIKCGEAGKPTSDGYQRRGDQIFYGYPKRNHAQFCFNYLTSKENYVTVDGDNFDFNYMFNVDFRITNLEIKIIATMILACKSFQLLYDQAQIDWDTFLKTFDDILKNAELTRNDLTPHFMQMIAVLAIAELFSVYFEPMQTDIKSLILGDFIQVPARRDFVNDGGLYPYKNGNETEEYAQIKYCTTALQDGYAGDFSKLDGKGALYWFNYAVNFDVALND